MGYPPVFMGYSGRWGRRFAYERHAQPRAQRSLQVVASDDEREPVGDAVNELDELGRHCPVCDAALPPASKAGRPRLYCSGRCRRDAYERRAAAY